MTTAHLPDDAEVPPPRVEEVSEGIFAYIQPNGGWGLNNAGFIVGREAVTAIDTCFTVKRSRAFAEAVRTAAGARPVQTLVNTHHHGDHTHGNFVFAPGATIIGHERCRQEAIATGLGTTAFWPQVDWGEIRLAPPFVTFAERLNVYADDLRVELIYVGPAHTTNDIVAWVPERKLLFAGDVIFNGGTPFVVMGSLAGSLAALETLRGLGAERIVPGHGPVCAPAVIDDVAAYLRFVRDVAGKGFAAGAGPLELALETDLGRFGEWLDRERLVANLHRAYSELRGEPQGTALPLAGVMPDMVAYNGGQMPRCLA
ncbi:MAG: MBL fold metallo-hydrolase [Dehalococcoidia bacterium]|nr:MBL fold metallo-hydrolase [Dehalococcoidia bacterium]